MRSASHAALPHLPLVRVCGAAGEGHVPVLAIAAGECRFPHLGSLRVGDDVAVHFLEGVSIEGEVAAVGDAQMTVRLARPASPALVEYFSPGPAAHGPSLVLHDSLGRPLPPLDPRRA